MIDKWLPKHGENLEMDMLKARIKRLEWMVYTLAADSVFENAGNKPYLYFEASGFFLSDEISDLGQELVKE